MYYLGVFAAVPIAPRSPEAIDWNPSYVELSWKEPTSDPWRTRYYRLHHRKRDKYRQVSLEGNNTLVLANTCLLTYLFNNSVMSEKLWKQPKLSSPKHASVSAFLL